MGAGLSSRFEWGAGPTWTTSARLARSALSAGVVSGLLTALLAVAVATALPAVAIDDRTRPDVQVTHGPSCRPGGIVVEVVAGTAAYTVRLSTTRRPAGEDEVTLAPRDSAVLQTGNVAPGETIDPRLEFTALDGSGTTYVDELADYTLTRPTTEDCELARNPPIATTMPGTPAPSESESPSATPSRPGTTSTTTTTGSATTGSATTGSTTSGSATGSTTSGAGTSRPTPAPTADTPARTSGAVVPPVDGPGRGDGQAVVAGGTVTLRGAGFLPGEPVQVLLHGTDTVLATTTAGADGAVRVEVRIPDGATTGPATLDLVGVDSALSAGVDLRVAAAEQVIESAPRGAVSLASLIAAATALVLTVAALVSVAGSQHGARRGRSATPAA